jgi:transcriptional regulator with XRE-family HTH domain
VNTLGERLSAVRERRGLTQGEVARRIGLPQQAISRLERGEREHVRSDVLARLAIALDVSADVLLGLRDMTASETALSTARPREETHDTKPTKRQRLRKAAPIA